LGYRGIQAVTVPDQRRDLGVGQGLDGGDDDLLVKVYKISRLNLLQTVGVREWRQHMWKPWGWGELSNQVAVDNARAASTELSRRRGEREEVELFLADHLRHVTKTA
jgi:hypothetical protein